MYRSKLFLAVDSVDGSVGLDQSVELLYMCILQLIY